MVQRGKARAQIWSKDFTISINSVSWSPWSVWATLHTAHFSFQATVFGGPLGKLKNVWKGQNEKNPKQPIQFSRSVGSDSATPWTAARQASLSITNSQSLLKLMSIESVMPSNYLILYRPLILQPSVFLSTSPSSEYSGLISFSLASLISLPSKGLSRVFSSIIIQKHQFFSTQLSFFFFLFIFYFLI